MLKILITRPKTQAEPFAENLRKAGLDPVYFPVIEIHPIDNNVPLQSALHKLGTYDWLIFTSVNGVAAFWKEFSGMGMTQIPGNVQVASIGPKTAEALKTYNIVPAFVPDDYVAEAILPGLGDLRGRWVLLPRAEIARKALPEAIMKAGGVAHEIVVYRTLPAEPDPQGLRALRAGLDVVTLTSPSTVHNFVAIVRAAGLDPHSLPGNPVFACIGPITAQAAQMEDLPNRIVADEYTTEGLVRAIQTLEKRRS